MLSVHKIFVGKFARIPGISDKEQMMIFTVFGWLRVGFMGEMLLTWLAVDLL